MRKFTEKIQIRPGVSHIASNQYRRLAKRRNRFAAHFEFGRTCLFWLALGLLAICAGQAIDHLFDPSSPWGLAALTTGGAPLMFGMMLPKLLRYDQRVTLNPGATTLLGTEVRVDLNRVGALEEMFVNLNITTGNPAPSSLTAAGILGLLKQVEIVINDGTGQRSVVKYSGLGLLEYCQQVGIDLDSATLQAVSDQQGQQGFQATQKYQICYRIPLVHPLIIEPLRTRMLLPVMNHVSDPILILTFASAAEMYGAGSLTAVICDVVLARRDVPPEVNAGLVAESKKAAGGGYVDYDLMETPFAVGVGISGEQRFSIPTPGYYANLLIRHFKGGASVTRGDISESTTIGSETQWSLVQGLKTFLQFRNRHVQVINDYSRKNLPFPARIALITDNTGGAVSDAIANTAGANPTTAEFENAVASITAKLNRLINWVTGQHGKIGAVGGTANNFQDCSSILLDFLTDLNGAEANELGSLLDCQTPQALGEKVELVGNVASGATNGHTLYVGGLRFRSDVRRYMAFR